MNIKDYEHLIPTLPTGDKLLNIITRQTELMHRYHAIEAPFRLTQDVPVNLSDRFGQLLLKDFAWRVTEEVSESIDALQKGDTILHAQEELSDAFHFLVEMSILSAWNPNCTPDYHDDNNGFDMLDNLFYRASSPPATIETSYTIHDLNPYDIMAFNNLLNRSYTNFITSLGMVCHTLKNKPWKQSHMLTDELEFYHRLSNAFRNFCHLCAAMGMTSHTLYIMYFLKSEVNSFRLRSAY